MKYALNLDENGRILSVSYVNEHTPANAVQVEEKPDGNVYEYLYVAGKFIHDPLPTESVEEPETVPSVWDELDAAYQEGVDSV